MRRILLMMLFLLLLTYPAQADTAWSVVNEVGETIDYPRTDTEWGYITYFGDVFGDEWVDNFCYEGRVYDVMDGYITILDESTGVQTFRRGGWVGQARTPEEIAAYAQSVNGELVFTHDRKQNLLMLPGKEAVKLPEGGVIQDGYDRRQRLFLTIDTADDRHFLCIVTWADGLDVRTIEMPWSGYFDSYHVGDENDCIYLWLDMFEGEDASGRIAAYEVDGRWKLGMVNAIGMYFPEQFGALNDMYGHFAYGTHEWNDIETMNWNTLPMTYEDMVAALHNEGWRFPQGDAPIYAAADVGAALVCVCPQDTPVCVIRTEGEWAYVGAQINDESGDPYVGWMLLSKLAEMPMQRSIIPGGEMGGWFCTMTVEDGVLTFAPIDDFYNYQAVPVQVRSGFAEAARAVYLEKGYAATPIGFDESLLPYLKYHVPEYEAVCDAVVTETVLAMAVRSDRYASGAEWELCIVTGTPEERDKTVLQMPGPFRFTWEDVLEWGSLGIELIE